MRTSPLAAVTRLGALMAVALAVTVNPLASGATVGSGSLVFAVEADPHMDEQSDEAIYRGTLQEIVANRPAFLVDLGDTFMIDKLPDKSTQSIRARYELMKGYFALLGPRVPLHLAMGNHDGEAGWDSLNTKSYRQEYFSRETLPLNYYSFTDSGSLFIVLDPYSYTTRKPNQDGWLWTLGRTQYDWLKAILLSSHAEHRYVFIHQLVGGDNQGRGGVEYADLFEWGGQSPSGSYDFDSKRPEWGKPIHQVLAEGGVEIVFKGHDHFYARQVLDGVVYQTVPQPSHPGDKAPQAVEYGYTSGKVVGGSGFLRVTVRGSETRVDFVRSTGAVAASYTVTR